MLHDWQQRQLSRIRTVIYRWYDMLAMSKSRWRWPGNPNGRSKFCNLRLFTLARSQLMLRRWLRSWRRLPEIAQTAHCRRQTHHRRWPGNPNDWSKFSNLRFFTLARSQLTLRRRLRGGGSAADSGFRRSLKWHVANVKHIVGDDHATLMVDRNFSIYVCLH